MAMKVSTNGQQRAALKALLAAKLALVYEEQGRDRHRGRLALGPAQTPGTDRCPRKRNDRARSVVKAAEQVGAGIVQTKMMVTVVKRAAKLVPLVEAELVTVPQAKALAKLKPMTRAAAIKRVLSGEKTAEVLKALLPPPDPTALTAQERKAVQILRRSTAKRQQLILAKAGVTAASVMAQPISSAGAYRDTRLGDDMQQERALAALEGRPFERSQAMRKHAPYQERSRLPEWRL